MRPTAITAIVNRFTVIDTLHVLIMLSIDMLLESSFEFLSITLIPDSAIAETILLAFRA